MKAHRKDETVGVGRLFGPRFTATRAVETMCVSLPGQQGIPKYPITQAWAGNYPFGFAVQGT